MTGWFGESFARKKHLKPLTDYLKPEPTDAERRDMGARDVMAMLDQLASEGTGDGAR